MTDMNKVLSNLVATACNLDEVDDADYIAEVTLLAKHVLAENASDTLLAIYSRGPLEDGDTPSKSHRDILLSIGVITKCVVNGSDGYQVYNYLGRDVVRVLSLKG